MSLIISSIIILILFHYIVVVRGAKIGIYAIYVTDGGFVRGIGRVREHSQELDPSNYETI